MRGKLARTVPRGLHGREAVELPNHTLEEALDQAAILSDIKPEIAIVDRGYQGAEPDGVKSTIPACDTASRAHCAP